MSYDLQLRARKPGAWSAGELASCLDNLPRVTSAGPRSWQAQLDSGDAASIDLIEVPRLGTAIEVSASHELSEPAIDQLYDLCASMADQLGGVVYDPQGDATYSARQLRTAAGNRWSREVALTAAEVAFGGLALVVGGCWWLAGEPRTGLWLGSALAPLAVWLVLRVVRNVGEKHR